MRNLLTESFISVKFTAGVCTGVVVSAVSPIIILLLYRNKLFVSTEILNATLICYNTPVIKNLKCE